MNVDNFRESVVATSLSVFAALVLHWARSTPLMESTMAKQTSDKISEIASKALKTGKATMAQIKALAASALGQDESKGRRPAKKATGARKASKTTTARGRKAAAKPRKAVKAKR
jgi:hypothetical protein